jgi:hypothetical protein
MPLFEICDIFRISGVVIFGHVCRVILVLQGGYHVEEGNGMAEASQMQRPELSKIEILEKNWDTIT